MSEERVPTLAQVVADLQDTVLAHDKDLKIVAAIATTVTRRVARMGEEVAAQEDRLRVIVERLESLERDRYAAEQLTTVHLRMAAIEAKLAAHLESIGQLAAKVQAMAQRIEMLEGRPDPLAAALKEIAGWLSLHTDDGVETIVAIRDIEIVVELSSRKYSQCKARVCMATGDTIAVRETLAEIMAMLADRPAAPRPPEGPLFVRLAVLEAKLAAHLESIGQLAQRVEQLEQREEGRLP